MKTPVSILLLAILFNASSAQLRNSGTVELGGGIAYSSYSESNSSSSSNIFQFDPYIGFMVGGGWETGVKLSLISAGGDETSFGGFFAPSYNFKTNNNVVPYIEFLLGYATIGSGSSSAKGLGIGGDAGLKIVTGTSGLVLVKFEYVRQEYNMTIDNYNYYPYPTQNPETVTYTINMVTFGVGFRLFFGHAGAASGTAPKTN